MKPFIYTALVAGFAASGISQTDTVQPGEVRLSARASESDGPLKNLQGMVRIETAHVIIQADQAVYNSSTFEVHASGNVRISLNEKNKLPR